jgi:hypothetical protein
MKYIDLVCQVYDPNDGEIVVPKRVAMRLLRDEVAQKIFEFCTSDYDKDLHIRDPKSNGLVSLGLNSLEEHLMVRKIYDKFFHSIQVVVALDDEQYHFLFSNLENISKKTPVSFSWMLSVIYSILLTSNIIKEEDYIKRSKNKAEAFEQFYRKNGINVKYYEDQNGKT